jgi:hypothetical protein
VIQLQNPLPLFTMLASVTVFRLPLHRLVSLVDKPVLATALRTHLPFTALKLSFTMPASEGDRFARSALAIPLLCCRSPCSPAYHQRPRLLSLLPYVIPNTQQARLSWQCFTPLSSPHSPRRQAILSLQIKFLLPLYRSFAAFYRALRAYHSHATSSPLL